MQHSMFRCAIGFVIGLAATTASAINVKVRGTYDPWLAGMPFGSHASIDDSAPNESPVLVPRLHFSRGGYVTFSGVTGDTSNTPQCCLSAEGGMMISHLSGAENGIGNAIAPLGTLMGVFLDDRRPDSFRAPGALDFSGAGALDFKRLSPRLKQVFFIGDGLAAGTLQRFYVPNGATRLFLGTMDGYEWNNNSGAFNLKVKVNYLSEQMANTSAVPEPETYALMLTGLAMTGFAATRRRQ
jgi:hypothetical protein